ncbi:HRDC-like protein [Daldinia vernicosa]|uniref:HRDC-like protein n=1 Tax=Daldinia vernicosa TaxID=114800 RepID=UPI0020073F80|nr:HRDC-like protein [Daldinia vernicosa]KAI0850936.1 HRDC-like protein [Daldinia vernicosa]
MSYLFYTKCVKRDSVLTGTNLIMFSLTSRYVSCQCLWKFNPRFIMTTNDAFTSRPFVSKVKHNNDNIMDSSHGPPTGGNFHATYRKFENSSVPEVWHKLFGQLVEHRKKVAAAQGVPIYLVASNKVLEELAKTRPTNKFELLKVKGIRDRKAEAYGDEWLEIIAQDIAKHPKTSTTQTNLPLEPRDDYQKQQESGPSKELYRRLAEHRTARAAIEDWPPYIVASNSLLENLSRERPSNQRELLEIRGVGTSKAAEYGPDWLQIIAEFKAEYKSESPQPAITGTPETSRTAKDTQQPQLGDRPFKQSRIRNVGRSKEIILSQLPSSGLSLEVGGTQSNAAEASAEKDDGDNYDDPDIEEAFMSLITPRESPQLKREQSNSSVLPHETQSLPPISNPVKKEN